MAETIYIGYDNKIRLELLENGSTVDLDARGVTKMGVLYKERLYHSANFTTAFDYSSEATSGIVTIDLANISGFETGRDRKAELIVWDAVHTNGLVWGTFDLTAKSLTATVITPP